MTLAKIANALKDYDDYLESIGYLDTDAYLIKICLPSEEDDSWVSVSIEFFDIGDYSIAATRERAYSKDPTHEIFSEDLKVINEIITKLEEAIYQKGAMA